jgi:murein DD-endopeptidase MepM/ murein hydrolase activator NlpD
MRLAALSGLLLIASGALGGLAVTSLAGTPGLAGGLAGAGQPMSCSGYRLSQDYGPVAFEAEPELFGFPHFHSGWDLVCPAGTPVLSVTAGLARVDNSAAGYGISVVVSWGDLHIRYAHLAELLVSSGDAVVVGRELGREGSTGNSTGAHLHFEVGRGCALASCSINPATLIANPAEAHGR